MVVKKDLRETHHGVLFDGRRHGENAWGSGAALERTGIQIRLAGGLYMPSEGRENSRCKEGV